MVHCLSPCSTPVVISKKCVSPSGYLTIELVLLYNMNMSFTISPTKQFIQNFLELLELMRTFEKFCYSNH